MLEKDGDFVPVSSLNTFEKRVGFVGDFPEWLDLDKIAINWKRTQTICNLGGIYRVLVWGSNDGESSKTIPQIAGFNLRGEAYASKVSASTQVPFFDNRSTALNSKAEHPFREVVAHITLNNNEIVQRIQNQGKNVRSTEAWAHHINKSLGQGLENIGLKHLVIELNRRDNLLAVYEYVFPIALLTGINTFYKLIGLNYHPDFTDYLLLYAAGLSFEFIRRVHHRGRLSLFYGPQLDRALALVALTRTSRLVKSLPETS